MVDNRSAGFFGIGGSFNFKGGDISGTAAKTQDDKMGQGGEYASLRKGEDEEEQQDNRYMDRSAVLRATLNSLAMMNVANVINSKKQAILDDKDDEEKKQDKRENQQEKEEEQPVAQAVEEHLLGDEYEDYDSYEDYEDFDFAGELDD